MRAYHTLIVLAAMLAIAGVASAQNAPCPECDTDGEPVENNYYSVDLGVIENDSAELLGDTDTATSHSGDEKGFWLWFTLCLSAWISKIEEAIGIQTDIDANAEIYADSEGVDVDASLHGVQHVCAAVGVQTSCEFDFDRSAAGDLDGQTYKAIAAAEATTGVDVFVPAPLPDTGDHDVDVCVYTDLQLC